MFGEDDMLIDICGIVVVDDVEEDEVVELVELVVDVVDVVVEVEEEVGWLVELVVDVVDVVVDDVEEDEVVELVELVVDVVDVVVVGSTLTVAVAVALALLESVTVSDIVYMPGSVNVNWLPLSITLFGTLAYVNEYGGSPVVVMLPLAVLFEIETEPPVFMVFAEAVKDNASL